MKQGQFAVLCVILLALWATDAKAQDHETRIKQLEDLIEKFDGHLDRIKEEYDKKLAEKLKAIRQEIDLVYFRVTVPPVGTILPFYGDPAILLTFPEKWKLCEGQEVTDKESPFFNQKLPDLRKRFLRGAENYADLGSEGLVFVPNQLNKITGTAQNIYLPRNSVSGRIGADKVPIGTKWFLTEDHNVHLKFAKRAPFNSDTSPADSHDRIGGTGTISGESDISGLSQNKRIYHSVFFIIRIR